MTEVAARGRLVRLVVAGLLDSLFLSVAWTLLVLDVVDRHGLAAAGALSAAMLVGVALSAPIASRAGRSMGGRTLLRTAATAEAVLRLLTAGLVLGGAPLWAAALAVTAMNVLAWTGYAGMRAEVAALGLGGAALTTYGTVVAAVEAAGVALAALLPADGVLGARVLTVALVCYVLGLAPTVWVAGGSTVPRATSGEPGRSRSPLSPPVVAGAVLMLLASGPTLLAVALAEQFFDRTAVAPAALAFVVGSVAAPWAARYLDRRPPRTGIVWWVLAAGVLGGWALAPAGVVFLCLAQLLSGACLTLLEGVLDASAARYRPDTPTGALASAAAGRALGSAAATAVLPTVVTGVGLVGWATGVSAGLLAVGLAAAWVARDRIPARMPYLPPVPRAVPRPVLVGAGAGPARVAPG